MGLFKKIALYLIIPTISFSYFNEKEKSHLFYLMHNNEIKKALGEYQQLRNNTKSHDFDALQHIAFILLKQGIANNNLLEQQLTLFGASISSSTYALSILEKGLTSEHPEAQLLALHFIKDIYDDKVNEIITKSMHSDYLIIRMEAAFLMAIRKHPLALGHIESLMYKLPPMFKPFFPFLFIQLGTPGAISVIKQLLHDVNTQVRVEAILGIANFERDDLLPFIRRKISCGNVAEIEACAYGLGKLKDTSCISTLKKLMQTTTQNARLSSARALILLENDPKAKKFIEKMAMENNPFAISLLGDIEGSEDVLAKLLKSDDITIRLNAAIALLNRKDPRCSPVLLEILITDVKDIILQPNFSLGRSIMCWKVVPSSSQRKKDPMVDPSLAIHVKEFILKQALDLPEKDFLAIAEYVFRTKQNDLVPILVMLLENIHSPKAIALLKKYSQKTGSPLIRDYCNLGLFRLKEEGPYEEYVINWTMKKKDIDLIRLRPIVPLSARIKNSNYDLSAEESSRLLVEMYMSLAQKQDERLIDILIEMIKEGKPSNRYALGGLLLRAIE